MKKQLKFVDGVYGFLYSGVYGYTINVFDKPITETELKAMYQVISDDDCLFIVGDEDTIVELWEINDDTNLDELDINEDVKVVEWK